MNILQQLRALAGLSDPNATFADMTNAIVAKMENEPNAEAESVLAAYVDESRIENELRALIGGATESVTAVRQVLRQANADEIETLIARAAPDIWDLFSRVRFDPQELLPQV
jgi:hypothetical protein